MGPRETHSPHHYVIKFYFKKISRYVHFSKGIVDSRIIVAPRVKKFLHLDRLRFCSLFVDTLIYTAHSTASDALWAGIPLLTIRGQTFASRVAATLNENAGVGIEMVVHSKHEFVDTAV